MVFASPQPELGEVALAFGELGVRLTPYLHHDLLELACEDYAVDCNWKFVVENHIDVYHLWYLHKQSLGAFDHPAFRYEQLGPNWWSEESLRDPSDPPRGLSYLSDEQSAAIGAHLFFPNLMLVTTGDYFATYDAVPLDAVRTRLTLRIWGLPGANGKALVAQVRSFLNEDIVICRRLQQAVTSRAFALGPLARTHEAPMLAFHDHLRQVMDLENVAGNAI
jgi:Rieske 2Fe-2S family protein